MTPEQIKVKLTEALKNGVGFANSSYARAPEWQRTEFNRMLKNVQDSKIEPNDVHNRWVAFKRGMRVGITRLADMVMGEES